MHQKNLFKYFKTSQEIIRLAVMYYVRYPLIFRQVEDILHERGIDISHETVRFWVELVTSEEKEFNNCAHSLIGSGIWTKFL